MVCSFSVGHINVFGNCDNWMRIEWRVDAFRFSKISSPPVRLILIIASFTHSFHYSTCFNEPFSLPYTRFSIIRSLPTITHFSFDLQFLLLQIFLFNTRITDTMSSIVMVQCGEAANAVGSHFWNAQVNLVIITNFLVWAFVLVSKDWECCSAWSFDVFLWNKAQIVFPSLCSMR